jgi:hypothetical protein
MTPRRILAFICMTCVAALASAGTLKFVDVPAGDLADAVELLARQYEVNVMYPGGLLSGRKTQGFNGAFEAADAFRKLLESTPLVLSKEGDALLIAEPSRESQQATAPNPADGLPKVVVEARREAAEAGDQPTRKREPIFGWARHNAKKQATLAIDNARRLDSKCQRLAKMGDKKIQVYCSVRGKPHPSVRTASVPEAPPGDTSCRRLIKPGSNRIQSFCGDRALWEEFDIWAVDAKVTCRLAGTMQELCLTAAQWNNFDPPRVDNVGSNWPAPPVKVDNSGYLYSPTSPDRITTPSCGCTGGGQ